MRLINASEGVLLSIEKIRNRMKKHLVPVLKEYGLNYSSYLMLCYLHYFSDKTQYDMSRELHISKSSVNKYIKGAEKSGYIYLEQKARGALIVKHIKLSTKGLKALEETIKYSKSLIRSEYCYIMNSINTLVIKILYDMDNMKLDFEEDSGLLMNLERMNNTIYSKINYILEDYYLNPNHYLILNYIYFNGGSHQKDMVKDIDASKQKINLLVKYLKEEGMVEIGEETIANRRLKVINLSDKGRKELELIHIRVDKMFEEAFTSIQKIDFEILKKLLIGFSSHELN